MRLEQVFFYRWNGRIFQQREKHVDLVNDVNIDFFEPEYNTTHCFESGANLGAYRDSESGCGILHVLLQHNVEFTSGNDKCNDSLVSSDYSIQLKKIYPGMHFHCTWENIPQATYMVEFPRGKGEHIFSLPNTLVADVNMSMPFKRKRRTELLKKATVVFSAEIPWIYRMYTEECEVFDSVQDITKVEGSWSEIKFTSASDKYLCSMFFPDNIAQGLTDLTEEQLLWNKHEEEKNIYRGNIHSLFVGINPTLMCIKCMCIDLVLNMILVSNGRFCHRESVGQLIYMTKYMDKIFQLDSPDEMSPYVYI